RLRGEPALARSLHRRARLAEGALAGDRDRARDSAELHRQQALVVPAVTAARVAARALALVSALALVPAAHAATSTPGTTTNPLAPASPATQPSTPRLTNAQVSRIFLRDPKVASWLERYPKGPVTQATYDKGTWTVNVSSGNAGEVATGKVDDATGSVTEAWTGPQVAWTMGRGYPGAFGGTKIN